jgi:hypothetical protein
MTLDTQIETNSPPQDGMRHKTITERKIGKVTYLVVASHSATAQDTLKSKIEKLILRDCGRMAADERKKSDSDVSCSMSTVVD